jgi:hypothetical protein
VRWLMAVDRCAVLRAATQRHNVKFVKLPKHAPPLARVQALRDLRPGEVGAHVAVRGVRGEIRGAIGTRTD